MEIISHPGPDRSVTIEDLKNFKAKSRRYRNRRIGDYLKELHLTEGRNTGFKKIVDALKANGSPMPEFETDEGHTYFISRFYVHGHFYDETVNINEGSAKGAVKDPVKDPVEDPVKDPVEDSVKDPVEDSVEDSTHSLLKAHADKSGFTTESKIYEIIKNNPKVRRKDIAEQLEMSMGGIRKAIKRLSDKGILHFEGNSRTGRWIMDNTM